MAEELNISSILELPKKLLADITLGDSGRYAPNIDQVAVRGYPYPYQAALAVSNDCDSQSMECALDWQNFVNGTKSTPYGDGLGLEVGNSFWIYGMGAEPALFRSNPFDPEHPQRPEVDKIVELGKLGWLDTLHSFGNWALRKLPPERESDPTVFSRDQIQRGLDRLDELGLKPTVYVNHSGSPSNFGGPWGWYQKIDEPTHNLYAFDLLQDFGFRFFWLDCFTQTEKFGENLDYGDAQTLRRTLQRYRWHSWLRRNDEQRDQHPLEMPESDEDRRELLVAMFNRPMIPVRSRDGRMTYGFKRYRDIDQPVSGTFPMQVTAAKLDALEQARGNVVVYQHFGVFGPRGRSPLISKPHRKRSPIPALDEHTVETWRMIAERNKDGRLFVATTGRLLDWLWRRDTLRFSVEETNKLWTITLEEFDCPVSGRRPVEDADLNGLALTVPTRAPEVQVVRRGRQGSLPVKRAVDVANLSTDAIYLDWNPLEWPE